MIVVFAEDYLRELYTKGQSGDKKHRFQPDVAKRYKRAVDYLKRASKKEDLFRLNSLHFEALRGDKDGLFSVRVNNQYRIEFSLSETEEEPVMTICNIVELSNHYE